MKGYYCPQCKKTKDPNDKRRGLRTELHYRQIHGMRCKQEHDGKEMFHAWCPVCEDYLWVDN